MTTTPQTAEQLREQRAELQTRADATANAAGAARESHARLRALEVLDEATSAEVDSARAAVEKAEDTAAALADALAEVTTRLAAAEQRESEESRAAKVERGRQIAAERTKADKRRAGAVTSFVKHDTATAAYDAELRLLRADLAAHADEREEQKRQEWRDRILEMQRNPPQVGWEPNYPSLEHRMEQEITAMRQAVAAEVDALIPPPDDGALGVVVVEHPDIALRLLDPATRQALAEGLEFVNRPEVVSSGHSYVGSTSRRVYGDTEAEAANSRYEAMVKVLQRLRGSTSAPTIAELTSAGAEPQVVH